LPLWYACGNGTERCSVAPLRLTGPRKGVSTVDHDSKGQTLLEVDGRRRISLGSLAEHDRYLAAVEADGTIVLTPAVVMPLAEARLHAAVEAAEAVDDFLDDPSGGSRRSRPAKGRPRRQP